LIKGIDARPDREGKKMVGAWVTKEKWKTLRFYIRADLCQRKIDEIVDRGVEIDQEHLLQIAISLEQGKK
jgi:hypothetical protein